jgi:hypothetical protein
MHDRLFEGKPRTEPETINIAQELSLDSVMFTECMGNEALSALRIKDDLQTVKRFQLSATPDRRQLELPADDN